MIEPRFAIETEVEKDTYGKFIIEPLVQGYGHTLGTALRRVLLSSLKGAAVTMVKIDGVRHQFSTLPGLKEDIVELILNIKKLRLKYEGDEAIKMKLSAKGKGVVKSAQIEAPSQVTIVDKDIYLCTLTHSRARLNVDFVVEAGYGYLPFEEKRSKEIGAIPIDAIFTPVTRVNYKVESTRVGRMTDLDKLIIEVWTDGSIAPLKAIKSASQILVSYFTHIHAPKKEEKKESEPVDSIPKDIARLTLEELELPTRIVNALSNGGIETVGDLVEVSPKDLLKIKNVGVKSLAMVGKELSKKGIKFMQEEQS